MLHRIDEMHSVNLDNIESLEIATLADGRWSLHGISVSGRPLVIEVGTKDQCMSRLNRIEKESWSYRTE